MHLKRSRKAIERLRLSFAFLVREADRTRHVKASGMNLSFTY